MESLCFNFSDISVLRLDVRAGFRRPLDFTRLRTQIQLRLGCLILEHLFRRIPCFRGDCRLCLLAGLSKKKKGFNCELWLDFEHLSLVFRWFGRCPVVCPLEKRMASR